MLLLIMLGIISGLRKQRNIAKEQAALGRAAGQVLVTTVSDQFLQKIPQSGVADFLRNVPSMPGTHLALTT